jgi:hypothetical protein
MAWGVAGGVRASLGLLAQMCFALLALTPADLLAQEVISGPRLRRETLRLTSHERRILDDAASILGKSSLSDAERQVRLNSVEAVLTGTVAVPDDDNPEVRNPSFWTLSERGYVVARNSTAVEAITDLWTVHDNDGAPVPRIWCYKYSSLIMARAYIQHFQDTENNAGLAAMNGLIGHKVFPGDLPNGGERILWKRRKGNADLLPGDQVWFENPYFDRGRELIKQRAYEEAVHDGKSADEAATMAEKAADSAAAGEEGSNVFYLGNNQVARGAVSVVRAFRGSFQDANQAAAPGYEQIYTRKIFTVPQYRQHIIDGFYTVQAIMQANPNSVHPDDFQIKQVRSFVDPNLIVRVGAEAEQTLQLDRLIDGMASRNKEPKLMDSADARVPLFSDDYDWSEQGRVRAAMLAVLRTKCDEMWWRLRERGGDKRYVLTASRGKFAANFSVGSFCCDFASADLSRAYERHLPAVPGRLPSTFHPENVFWKNEKKWSRTRKPLYLMQIEVCQRAIQQWASVKGTTPGKEGPFHTYTADEKARFLEAVKKEIEGLTRTKRAVFMEAVLPGIAAPSGWEGFNSRENGPSSPPAAAATAGPSPNHCCQSDTPGVSWMFERCQIELPSCTNR